MVDYDLPLASLKKCREVTGKHVSRVEEHAENTFYSRNNVSAKAKRNRARLAHRVNVSQSQPATPKLV